MLDEDDITLITVPGWGNSGAEHWQTAWERSYPLARRVEQGDWLYPECEAWVDGIRRTLEQVPGRWMLAAHSLAAMRRRLGCGRCPCASRSGCKGCCWWRRRPADQRGAGARQRRTAGGRAPARFRRL